jgi:hypothetical protein
LWKVHASPFARSPAGRILLTSTEKTNDHHAVPRPSLVTRFLTRSHHVQHGFYRVSLFLLKLALHLSRIGLIVEARFVLGVSQGLWRTAARRPKRRH